MPFKTDYFITKNDVKNATEITEQEYNEIEKHIEQVRLYLDKLINNEISINDVPIEYRDDVV